MQVAEILLGGKVEHPKLALARLAIMLLSTWIGTFILCGRKSLSPKFPYLQKFSKLSNNKRQQILVSWNTSYFPLLRILYAALKLFTLLKFFTQVIHSLLSYPNSYIYIKKTKPNSLISCSITCTNQYMPMYIILIN